MFSYLYTACLLCLVLQSGQAVPRPGHGAMSGFCNIADHCDVEECCIKFGSKIGQSEAPDKVRQKMLERFVSGYCYKPKTEGECVTKAKDTCETAADCKSSECCVSKRKPLFHLFFWAPKGHCQPMLLHGDRCMKKYDAWEGEMKVIGSCPCMGSLICLSNKPATHDMFRGEIGTCVEIAVNK